MNLNNFLIFIIISLTIWIGAWFYIGGGKNYSGEIVSSTAQIVSSVSSYYEDFEIDFSDSQDFNKKTDFNYVENQISQPLAKIISTGTNLILQAPHGSYDISKLIGSYLIYPDQVKDLGGYYFKANNQTFHVGKTNLELLTGDYQVLANNLAQNSGSLIFGAKKISDFPLQNYKLVGNILLGSGENFYFTSDGKNAIKIDLGQNIEYLSGKNYLVDGKKYLIDEFGENIITNRIFDPSLECLDIFLCKNGKNVYALYFSQDKLGYYGPKNGQLLKGVNGENFEYLGLLNNIRYYYNGNNIFIIKQNSRYRKLEKLSNYSKNNFINSCKGVDSGICKKFASF